MAWMKVGVAPPFLTLQPTIIYLPCPAPKSTHSRRGYVGTVTTQTGFIWSRPATDWLLGGNWKMTNLNTKSLHCSTFAWLSFKLISHLCICAPAVSEPTLKWKLKKLISMRPNPLQRKISAPPSVKHKTETLGKSISTTACLFEVLLCLYGSAVAPF